MQDAAGSNSLLPDQTTLGLAPLVVSAPFGNYIQPAGCTATLGTFTAEARPGRVSQTLKTVRYYPRLKAWINRIGLRNPGMPWLVRRANEGKLDLSTKLVSVHGFDAGEWTSLLSHIADLKPMGVELNMSCPNVGEMDWPGDLFASALATGVPVIVKLPPVNYLPMAQAAVQAGVRRLHCCNTLPVASGGLSGAPLKPVALQCIADLRARPWMGEVTILGGGGIRAAADIDDFADAGANAFALGTFVMNPLLLLTHRRVTPLLERARARSTMG